LVSLATSGIVLSASLCEGRALRVVAPRSLAAIGVVSYGFFLYHELLLGVVGSLVPFARGEPTWSSLAWTASIALAASIAAGYASWRLVELPVIRWAHRRRVGEAPAPASAQPDNRLKDICTGSSART